MAVTATCRRHPAGAHPGRGNKVAAFGPERRLRVGRPMRSSRLLFCAIGLLLGCHADEQLPGTDGGAGEPGADGAVPVHGLRGVTYRQYFDVVADRVDPEVHADWGDEEPVAGAGADHFAIRWTGELEVPRAGLYAFALDADDGVRLSLGDQRLIDA
jgi:hypothetical protein